MYKQIVASWQNDAKVAQVIADLQQGKAVKGSYTWANNELRRKDRLVVGDDQPLRTELLKQFHGGSVGGHSGVKTTTNKLCSVFY